MTNQQKFESEYKKAKRLINKSMNVKNIDKALSCLSAISYLSYEWNQYYTDEYIERILLELSDLIENKNESYLANKDVVLFYDGLAQDTRGLALIYMRALAKHFKIVYVTLERYKNRQPTLFKELENFDVQYEYVLREESNYCNIRQLCQIFENYRPSSAFLYTMPNDVVGIIAFTIYRKKNDLIRYQINLTDHAFWMGLNSFDFDIEFRDYGAIISKEFRKIPREKILKLPYYPYFDEDMKFLGFPFEKKDDLVIFSGGSLYKTLDDANEYYYVVQQILKVNEKCIFLYAGAGDTTQLDKLRAQFPTRVFHIEERKDLFQLMQHITLYLNTYPMVGGLMMQYAVIAGKIPLTLKHNSDGDGILINQKNIGIEYDNSNSLIKDANRLLNNKNYRQERESRLIGAVPTRDEFENELFSIIKQNKTKYSIEFYDLNTKDFLAGYAYRFNIKNYIHAIAKKKNMNLIFNYPKYFIIEFINEVLKKVRG